MSKREKIIVGTMLLAVVYAIYILFLASPRNPAPSAQFKTEKGLDNLNAFITKVADNTKRGLNKRQSYILKKAQEKWVQDPLVQLKNNKLAQQQNTTPGVLKGKIMYSGFLQMGNRRLAIINGMEYENGDKLEPGGYVVQRIYPNHVILITMDGNRKKFILPLEEMQ